MAARLDLCQRSRVIDSKAFSMVFVRPYLIDLKMEGSPCSGGPVPYSWKAPWEDGCNLDISEVPCSMSRKYARWKLPRLSSIFHVVTAWLWLLFFVLLKSKRIGPASECNATTTWSLWHHCVFAVGTLKGCPQGRRNIQKYIGADRSITLEA